MSQSSSTQDPLKQLWQSAEPAFDPAEVLRTIRREQRLQRRLVAWVMGIAGTLAIVSLVIAVSTGLPFPYLIPGLLVAAMLWQLLVTIRARRRLPNVAVLAGTTLLDHAIARAKISRRNGWVLAIAPALGALLGCLAIPPLLHLPLSIFLQPSALVPVVLMAAGLAGIAGLGLRMVRDAQHRQRVLEQRLKDRADGH